MFTSDKTVLKIPKAVADLAFWPLLKKHIKVEQLTLSGLDTQLTKVGSLLSVAGFSIASSKDVEKAPAPSITEKPTAFAITIPKLSIAESHILINYENANNNLYLNSITLSNIHLTSDALNAETSIRLGINDSQLNANLSLSRAGEKISVVGDMTLNKFNLRDTHIFLPDPQNYSGFASLQLKFKGTLNGNQLSAELQDSTLTLENIRYADDAIAASGGNVHLSLSRASAELKGAVLESVSTELDLDLKNISATNPKNQDTLVQLASLSFHKIQASQQNQNNDVKILSIMASDILTSLPVAKEQKKQPEPLLTLAKLHINKLTANDKHAQIAELLIQSPKLQLHIDPEGNIENLLTSTNETTEQKPAEKSTPSEQDNTEDTKAVEPKYTVAIDKIKLESEGNIHIIDRSIVPSFNKFITLQQAEITNLNSADTSETLNFTLSGKDSEFLSFNVHGKARPFGEGVNLSMQTKINEFALPEATGYTSKLLGFGVKRGQLNSNIKVDVVDSNIKGETVIYINAVKFSSSDTVSATSILDQSSVPLNVALGLLKDKNGNIKLKIPLSGNVNDPDFGVQHIIGLIVKKAVMMQAKNYLMATFVPYAKVVSVAMVAGSHTLKVRLEDLPYEIGAVEINESQKEYLQQFVALMQDDKKLTVHVCPRAIPAEYTPTTEINATPEDTQQKLIDLAKTRGSNFKRAAVEQGVESNRLLLCAPTVDKRKTAFPAIELKVQ